ncbi:MAG: hypothetical protein ACRCYV_03535 [Aeromonas sp.]
MSLDANTQAARVFWRQVQEFVVNAQPWQPVIYYEVKPDERWDASLVARRVYGRREEFMVIMAAAGIDSFDMPLPQKRLTLPSETQLRAMKLAAGFESRHDFRQATADGMAPTWAKV